MGCPYGRHLHVALLPFHAARASMCTGFFVPEETRAASRVAHYSPGPTTVKSTELDNFLPSSAQMAPVASQSVVADRPNSNAGVRIRLNGDGPADVAALHLPLCLLHCSSLHREGVIPQGLVAHPCNVLAPPPGTSRRPPSF